MSATVILDTNALMAPVERDLRLFEELERLLGPPVRPLVPAPVADELQRLATGGGRAATAAGVGRSLLERCEVVPTDAAYADDAVVELARAHGGYVVTEDRALRARLPPRAVHVIGIRGSDRLEVRD
ncbi:MAG: twitching motility protein PilT [Haloquadratum sp.]|nr:twitching motility protein PilT [Haloquadratum sp.]